MRVRNSSCPLKTGRQSVKESVFLALALTIHPRPAERTGDKTSSRLKTFIYPFCDRKENIYSFTSRSLRIAGTVKRQWQNINSYYSGDFIDKERPPQGTGRGLFKCSFAKESYYSELKRLHTHSQTHTLSHFLLRPSRNTYLPLFFFPATRNTSNLNPKCALPCILSGQR